MKTNLVRLFIVLCLTLGALIILPASPARAVTLTVSNCDDSGPGSLRQAVTDAVSGDTIDFSLDCPAASPITVTSYIDVTQDLTISGTGRDIVLNGNNATRIMVIQYSITVTLEYLTLKDGAVSDDRGGAIYDNGSYLTLSHVTFENNHVSGTGADGGAVFHNTNGSLTISNSAFTGNSAENYGGAIFLRSDATITDSAFTNNAAYRGGAYMTYTSGKISTFERVTMNGNTAIGPGNTYGQGGAIYLGFGTLNLLNSTLSGNGSASYTNAGGAIYVYDSNVTIKNSDIVDNLVDAANNYLGGGLLINTSTLSYFNTIMANNSPDDCRTDNGLAVAQNFNNLVEVSAGCGTPALTSDPNLGPLADNGGSTWTHSLFSGSPAIDSGDDSFCLATDQRGVIRPQGLHCDIGAFEYDPSPTVESITRFDPTPTSAASVKFTVTFSEPVNSVDTTDFTFTKTGSITGYAITNIMPVSGPADIYTVSVATGKYNGTLRLDVLNDGTIKDISGNPLAAGFTSGQVYTITKKYTDNLKSLGAQDGWALESGENTTKGGTINTAATTLRLGDDAAKKQYRGILSFGTSGLPDNAVITKVTLKFKQSGISGGGNPVTTFQGFVVDIKKGLFGTTALQASDFQTAASKTYGAFLPVPASNWYSINLTNGKAYVNKLSTLSGLTQIRLRFKLDDNNNAIANYLSLYSGNAGVANRPQLIIEYYVP